MILRAVMVGTLWLAAGCSGCDTPLPGVDLGTREPDKPDPEVIELGIALHPLHLSPIEATQLLFDVPPRYRLAYGLGDDPEAAIVDAYQRFKRRMRVRSLGTGQFRHSPPRGCRRLSCVFVHLAEQSQTALLPIAQQFLDHAHAQGLDSLRLASLIVAWVQTMEYRIPEEDPYGLLPPALVAHRLWGDCDSKALLATLILQMVGVDAVLVDSVLAEHSMVGVGLPTTGDQIESGGRRWAVVEVTAVGWPIGRMPPTRSGFSDWVVHDATASLRARPVGEDKGEDEAAKPAAPGT